MKNARINLIFLIVVAIIFIGLSQYTNVWWGRLNEGCTPFFFPAALILASIYGLLTRNYIGSFLVGFFSVPYLIPFPPYQTGSVIYDFILAVLGLTQANILELIIFIGFGIASGLFGIGFVKLSNRSEKSGTSQ